MYCPFSPTGLLSGAKLPVLRLFALIGQKSGLFAPNQVKCGRASGHLDPHGCAKCHVNRCSWWECGPQNHTKSFIFSRVKNPPPKKKVGGNVCAHKVIYIVDRFEENSTAVIYGRECRCAPTDVTSTMFPETLSSSYTLCCMQTDLENSEVSLQPYTYEQFLASYKRKSTQRQEKFTKKRKLVKDDVHVRTMLLNMVEVLA